MYEGFWKDGQMHGTGKHSINNGKQTVYDKWNHGKISDLKIKIKKNWCLMKRVLRKPGKNEIKMSEIFNKNEFNKLDGMDKIDKVTELLFKK